jgi:hypothetical protein
MKTLTALTATIFLAGCVTMPVPPFGSKQGELGLLHLRLDVRYEPRFSPERTPTDDMQYAWKQFGQTQPKLLKDK